MIPPAAPGSSPALTDRDDVEPSDDALRRTNVAMQRYYDLMKESGRDAAGPLWSVLMHGVVAEAIHSASEAAARNERNSWADAIRERQKGKLDLDLAGIKACAEAALIRPGHVIASAREVL